jgi:hypothetical protein
MKAVRMALCSWWPTSKAAAGGVVKMMGVRAAVVAVAVAVRTRPRELVLRLPRQQVLVHAREDFGQDPVTVTAAVLPCFV